jgi:group I intron endonuclease
LQNAFNKYGEENFEFKVILYCERNELTYYEQNLVDLWNPEYNICKICVTNRLGIKHTEKSKQKMSEIASGEKNPFFGKKHTDETKESYSLARKGVSKTEEHKKKISDSHIGMKESEETKAKVSKNHADTSGINGALFKSKEFVLEVKALLDAGNSINSICRIIGCCSKTVRKVRDGYYKDAYGI